ncbi:hypothetical protein C0J52_16285 [Blattella germanica]|nr:hypothetical protein C0J52_16285 [Blattella germanica]
MNVFPSLTNPTHVDVRFKNVQSDVYLCVKTDEMGKHTLATKTLSSSTDPEVDFSLYYYTSAEAGETKMVLPVHQATNVCFSMTLEKELQISSLISSSDGNELEGPREDPLKFSQADNRFFYIKKSGEEYALEAMNVDFSLYFYTSAEAAENKMVLPVHQATRACLRMTLDGKLELTFLGETEEPMALEKADSRFFYVRVVGTNYALEAMNGVNYDHYLALQEAGFDEYTIHFRENSGTDFPDDIQFQVDEMDA